MNLLGDGVGGDTSYGTPWRTGVEQTFGASLRGGSENVTYFLSGEFSGREGTLANNESTQRNFRANFNLFPSEKVDIALSTGYSYHLVVSAGQRQQRLRIHRSGHGGFPLGHSYQAYGPRRRWRMDDVSPRLRVPPCNGQRGGNYDVGKPFGRPTARTIRSSPSVPSTT